MRFKTLVVLAGIAAVLGMTATGRPADRKMTVGIGISAPFAPFVIAVEKGFMEKRGVPAEYKMFESGAPAFEAVIAGSLDAGMVSEFIFVPARAKGAPLALVSLFTVTGKDLGAVASKNIRTPKDLEGKTVGTAVRTSAEYFMYRYFEKHGVDASKVAVRNINPTETAPALFRGDIDAFFLWGNWIPKGPEVVPGARILAYSGDDNVFIQKQSLLFNSNWLRANRDLAGKSLLALMDTIKFIKEQPDEAARIAGKAFRIAPEEMAKQMAPLNYVVELRRSTIEEYKASTRWIVGKGGATIPDVDKFWSDLVDPSVIKSVAPEQTDF
ncbi:MAG TPA: ABC transporter substrate-binding protein [Candidatus Methylomirabilis sp.]|nr:ABC transporter substrate-binding protein [Candidatus Methylomirabilis sp.]